MIYLLDDLLDDRKFPRAHDLLVTKSNNISMRVTSYFSPHKSSTICNSCIIDFGSKGCLDPQTPTDLSSNKY